MSNIRRRHDCSCKAVHTMPHPKGPPGLLMLHSCLLIASNVWSFEQLYASAIRRASTKILKDLLTDSQAVCCTSRYQACYTARHLHLQGRSDGGNGGSSNGKLLFARSQILACHLILSSSAEGKRCHAVCLTSHFHHSQTAAEASYSPKLLDALRLSSERLFHDIKFVFDSCIPQPSLSFGAGTPCFLDPWLSWHSSESLQSHRQEFDRGQRRRQSLN